MKESGQGYSKYPEIRFTFILTHQKPYAYPSEQPAYPDTSRRVPDISWFFYRLGGISYRTEQNKQDQKKRQSQQNPCKDQYELHQNP